MNAKINNLYTTQETERLGLTAPTIAISLPRFFGQCAEDYLCLSMIRAIATREGLDLEDETYCEIGAFHPVSGSASYLLHVGLGMTGVLVEANPDLVPDLARARPHDRIRNLAVVPDDRTEANLYFGTELELSSVDAGTLSRFHGFYVQPSGLHRVPAVNLNHLMSTEFPNKAPLLLSLDIEGLDRAVLESYDFSVRPYVIQIEASEDYDKVTFLGIARTLEAHRYAIVQRTDVNQIAVDLDRFVPPSGLQSLPFGASGIDMLLKHVRILSLDVFDTILARRCVDPTDVFRWMENMYQLPGFATARVAAEKAARVAHRARGSEVALHEIYDQLSEQFPPSVQDLELASEAVFLYANPSVSDLIARARRQGLRVIAVSDIYLSSRQVDALLRSAGVVVDSVYTSSDLRDRNLGKYNSTVYSHVLDQEGADAEEVLHVGDNWQSDILNAQANGLLALETKQLHALACRHDPYIARIKKLCGGLATSTVVGELTRRKATIATKMSTMEEFGYGYGGPILAGFAAFLIEQAKEKGIDRLLLLERDGGIVAKALDILKPEGLSYRLVPASRRLAVFPLVASDGFDPIRTFFPPDEVLTEAEFFQRLVLPFPSDLEHKHRKQQPFDIFVRHAESLALTAKAEAAAIRAELAEELAHAERGGRLAWVDVGWALTSVSALNRLLGLDLPCFCLGSNDRVAKEVTETGYLFTRLQPAEVGHRVMQAVEPLEMLFSDIKPSVAYLQTLKDGVQPVYRPKTSTELVRDAYVGEVGRGALAFMKDFADLLTGLGLEDLRNFNRSVAAEMSAYPHDAFYEIIARAPHDRLAGANGWGFVGDFWRMSVKPGQEDGGIVSSEMALRSEMQMLRRKPLGALADLILYRVLRVAAKVSPPVPPRMAARFARSAAKRDPRR